MACARRNLPVKSVHRDEFSLYTELLRAIRQEAGHTQITIAAKLGRPQNQISTIERGKVRLDFLQLRDWCLACNTTLVALAARFDERLAELAAAPPAKAQRKASGTEKKSSGSAGPAAKAASRSSNSVTKATKSRP